MTKTLAELIEVFNKDPDEALATARQQLEAAQDHLKDTPRHIIGRSNQGFGEANIKMYGEYRQDILRCRELELNRVKRIHDIIEGMYRGVL